MLSLHLPTLVLTLAASSLAQDWTNAGGNPGRNGQTPAYGPLTPQVAWSGSSTSLIAWQPVIAGDRVFVVRQAGFVSTGEPNGSPVVCQDLQTGAILWTFDVPFATGDWTTWIAGVSDGKVYACRGGNGATSSAPIYALDQATGAVVWVSQDAVDAGAYDGVVFAPNGDLLVASFRDVWRIRAADGTTAWNSARTCSVTSSCGVCLHEDAVYLADFASGGGHVIKRYDLATGAFRYQGPVMPGSTLQNTPMVGPDGTIYLSRTQNNPVVDFFYAFDDDGSAITQRWSAPAGWGTGSEFAVGRSGNVYMLSPGDLLTALEPTTGAIVHQASSPLSYNDPRIAVDGDGRLFVSNGGFATGEVSSYDPDLTLRWSIPVANVNIGAPAIGADGTLVVAGISTNLTAYRTPSPWSTIAGGIPGASGQSTLSGRGTATPSNLFSVSLVGGRPNAPTALLVGLSSIQFPFLGGTLIPSPDLVASGIGLDAGGELELSFPWPSVLGSGSSIWFQHWYLDPTTPFGIAASEGLRGDTP